MKHRIPISALALLTILGFGCQPAVEQPEPSVLAEDVAAIRTIFADYQSTVNDGDAAGFADLHTEDTIRMPPNSPALVGKDAIRSDSQAFVDQVVITLSNEVAEVEVTGDWAFVRGDWKATVTPKEGGQTAEESGKWLSIAQRQPDGSWKLHRHTWNSNGPPPGVAD